LLLTFLRNADVSRANPCELALSFGGHVLPFD
jgi:hypothetical protein